MINNDLDNNIEVYNDLSLSRIPNNILGYLTEYIDYIMEFKTFQHMINISAIKMLTPYYPEYDK